MDKVDKVDRRAALEEEAGEIESRLAYIEAAPKRYAQERVTEIDQAIQGRRGGPGRIRPREAAPGHISMFTHLQGVKEAYQGGHLVQSEIAALRSQAQHRRAELTLGKEVKGGG